MNILLALPRRYWWILLLSAVIGAGLGYLSALPKLAPVYKGVVFVTAGIDQSKVLNAGHYDFYGLTEGADNFSETAMAWFRSPDMYNAFIRHAELAEGEHMLSGPRVSKQETQNFLVDFTANSDAAARKLITGVQKALGERLTTYNTNNNGAFTFTINPSLETSTPSPRNAIGIGAVIAILLTFLATYFWERLRGVIHDRMDAMTTLPDAEHIQLRTAQDIVMLSTYLASKTTTAILAGNPKDFEHYLLPLTRHLSKTLHKNVILMDANLQKRDLHTKLGFAQSMKGAKGITDFETIQDTNNFFVLERGNKTTLQFIPAGAGEGLSSSFVQSLASVSDMNLFVTTLPESPEVLSLHEGILVLFVKPGSTERETLQEAALLFPGKKLIVFV